MGVLVRDTLTGLLVCIWHSWQVSRRLLTESSRPGNQKWARIRRFTASWPSCDPALADDMTPSCRDCGSRILSPR